MNEPVSAYEEPDLVYIFELPDLFKEIGMTMWFDLSLYFYLKRNSERNPVVTG